MNICRKGKVENFPREGEIAKKKNPHRRRRGGFKKKT